MSLRGFGRPPTYYFLWILPRNLFSRFCGIIADAKLPGFILIPLILLFSRFYGIDLNETIKKVSEFRSFNEFFTRKLNPNARPINPDPNTLLSPVDGFVGEFGKINNGNLVQAKGLEYRVSDLLNDHNRMMIYDRGIFVTIYLAPQNYHRVHSMVQGEVREFSYIPGDLWTVGPLGVNHIPNLFARNERLTTYVHTDKGECAIVKVGATVVGRIRINYYDQISNRRGEISKNIFLKNPFKLERGQEIGLFEMGSTVICLFPPKQIELYDMEIGQSIFFGQTMGEFI